MFFYSFTKLLLSGLNNLYLDSELIWRFESFNFLFTQTLSSFLFLFTDLFLELFAFICMPALVLYLFPKITNVAEEIFDFLEGDILEGVFGSLDTGVVLLVKQIWFILVICIFIDYTGYMAGLGTNNIGEAVILSIVVLVGLSCIWWGFSVTILVIRFREYGVNILFGVDVALNIAGLLLVFIEFLSFITRAVSLGLRLFANLVAGATIEGLVEIFFWAGIYKIYILCIYSGLNSALLFFIYNLVLSISENIAIVVQPFIFTVLLANILSECTIFINIRQ